jgi:hypothetical protein
MGDEWPRAVIELGDELADEKALHTVLRRPVEAGL